MATVSVSEKIAAEIESLIVKGGWPPDNKMPSVRLTARQWGVSPVTILAALRLLREKGILEKYPGTGRYFLKRGPRDTIETQDTGKTARAKRIAQELREDFFWG